MLPMKL